MSNYSDFVTSKVAAYANSGHPFSNDELASQFIDAFNNGRDYRIQVDFGYGEKPVWGYVGVTTGWRPIFLLMRRRGQMGSRETLQQHHKILASKWLELA